MNPQSINIRGILLCLAACLLLSLGCGAAEDVAPVPATCSSGTVVTLSCGSSRELADGRSVACVTCFDGARLNDCLVGESLCVISCDQCAP